MNGVALFVISGVMAAGKSTVARLLASRFDRGVCVPGDAIRAMVVSGRTEMSPEAEEEALSQLLLRYEGALAVAAVYLRAGFDVVVEDVIVGPVLRDFLAIVPVDEFHLVFLDPEAKAIGQRDQDRAKTGYRDWSIEGLQRVLREDTDRTGLWLDSTDLTPEPAWSGPVGPPNARSMPSRSAARRAAVADQGRCYSRSSSRSAG
jgi:predicted kinase